MKKITQITSLITLLIVSSCTLYKAKNYLKEGEVVQENFKTVIPFEMKNGLIILKVTIKNKIHDFILDTGATNVVSKELAKELQLNTLDSVKVNDIYNESQALKYAKLDKVTIGDVDFIETVTLISDFKEIPTWSCLGVDGFIGSNLMKNAIWDFDFEKKIITITNDESKLNLPEDVIENKLFIGYGGLPSIMTKMNDRKVWNVTVDFGFNGGIRMPFSEFEKQKEEGIINNFVKAETLGVTGIYGQKNEVKESYVSIIDKIDFGNTTLTKERVTAEEGFATLFGLSFFKNYRVILNWKTKKIKLIEQQKTSKENYKSFGFSYSFKNNSFFISSLFEGTQAKEKLKIGDKIMSINGKDYSFISNEKNCSIMGKGIFGEFNESIKIEVLRADKKMIFSIKKEELL